MVDDSPEKHTRNYGNLVRIAPFTGNLADAELAHLARYLRQLATLPDVRCIEKRGWRLSVQGAAEPRADASSSGSEPSCRRRRFLCRSSRTSAARSSDQEPWSPSKPIRP
jgi:hypothetical protein